MTRFLVFLIVGYVVYILIKKSLKGKTIKNIDQPGKEKKADVADIHLKEIAYVYYSTSKDSDSCDICKTLDGTHLLPNHKMLHDIKPPHKDCKSSKGCRCTLVYVTRDEEGGREIEALLKKLGGVCDRKTIERNYTG